MIDARGRLLKTQADMTLAMSYAIHDVMLRDFGSGRRRKTNWSRAWLRAAQSTPYGYWGSPEDSSRTNERTTTTTTHRDRQPLKDRPKTPIRRATRDHRTARPRLTQGPWRERRASSPAWGGRLTSLLSHPFEGSTHTPSWTARVSWRLGGEAHTSP